MKNKSHLLLVARILVGVLFIFSGLIKANDPLGFGYKLEEYFGVFGMTFLNDLATTIAILLCTLEVVLGILLLLGIYARKVAWGLLLVIIFFTILTFVSAFFQVVTSCGCFGDAIPLTPWQSFGKDVILLVFILFIFSKKLQINPVFSTAASRKIAVATIVLSLFFALYTVNFLPVIDFLPYKNGVNIPQAMLIPHTAKPDVYEIRYHLKNKQTGEEKKMTDTEYLKTEIWKDQNWQIEGTPERKLIKKGFEPKIKDLLITDGSGTDYTKELIENPYNNLVIVAYDLDKTSEQALGKLNALSMNLSDQFNMRTVLLTSSSKEKAEELSKRLKFLPEIFYADGVPLKSMVRANPGVLLLKNGTIVKKWHYHTMPDFDGLSKKYLAQ